MSWASGRRTTRDEDISYSLLGLFNVNMPLLYGEGREKAFFRLQMAIIEKCDDQSILAWGRDSQARRGGVQTFARSPKSFQNCSMVQPNLQNPKLTKRKDVKSREARFALLYHSNAGKYSAKSDYLPMSKTDRPNHRHGSFLRRSRLWTRRLSSNWRDRRYC